MSINSPNKDHKILDVHLTIHIPHIFQIGHAPVTAEGKALGITTQRASVTMTLPVSLAAKDAAKGCHRGSSAG